MPSRLRVARTEAVVLRRFDLGEADRILTLFSPDRGKLRAIAKGVRRPQSRKAGHLEPFARVRLMLARGRELDVITQAEAIDLYPDLRQDLVALGHAAYVIELVDRFTLEEGENRGLYHLIVRTLERLAAGDSPAAVLRYFELRLLDEVGYRPELFRCVSCGAEIRPQDQFFSPPEGGVLCPDCGAGRKGARSLSLAGLKVLRHYQRSTYAAAAAPAVRPEVHAEVEDVMQEYLTFLLERGLNVPRFLRRVRELAGSEHPPSTDALA